MWANQTIPATIHVSNRSPKMGEDMQSAPVNTAGLGYIRWFMWAAYMEKIPCKTLVSWILYYSRPLDLIPQFMYRARAWWPSSCSARAEVSPPKPAPTTATFCGNRNPPSARCNALEKCRLCVRQCRHPSSTRVFPRDIGTSRPILVMALKGLRFSTSPISRLHATMSINPSNSNDLDPTRQACARPMSFPVSPRTHGVTRTYLQLFYPKRVLQNIHVFICHLVCYSIRR